jgi:hypothetical protein
MIISDTSSHAFEKISIDFSGPLNTTPEGYKHILTVQNCLYKYCILVPVKHANAEEVAKGLTEKNDMLLWTTSRTSNRSGNTFSK